MNLDRRAFLVGASGLTALALTACTGPPSPTRTSTTVAPDLVPRPTGFVRSRWSTDPFSLGAASYLPVGASPDARSTLADSVADRLFIAGEATSKEFPGTVQGAQSSGSRAAMEITGTAAAGERIAIIGAGLAGAAAARVLVDAGYEVLVLEGRDRLGGRTEARGPGDWPLTVELGPSFIRGVESSTLSAQLEALDIETVPFDADRASMRTAAGTEVPANGVGRQAVSEAVAWAALQSRDLSLKEALEGSGGAWTHTQSDGIGVSDRDRVQSYLTQGAEARLGADADSLSGWFGFAESASGSGGDALVLGSFERLVDAGLEGTDVSLSTPVRAVSYDKKGVRLTMATGESLRVDRVILTVPLGVLQSDAIEFDPPLPFAHRTAISTLGTGAVEKIWLRYDEPFWSGDAVGWGVVRGEARSSRPDSPPIDQWINLEPLTGDAVLMGLASGDAARAFAELSDDAALDAALVSLRPFFVED